VPRTACLLPAILAAACGSKPHESKGYISDVPLVPDCSENPIIASFCVRRCPAPSRPVLLNPAQFSSNSSSTPTAGRPRHPAIGSNGAPQSDARR
jgi:hypothetical protein